MKTIKEINSEIDEIRRNHKEAKKFKNRINFLNKIKYYLESEPREEFILSEIKNIKNKIDILESRFGEWKDGRSMRVVDPFNIYLHKVGIPLLKMQLKILKYIL